MTTYMQQVYDLRFFWWSLVCNDFKNRYKRSFLGVAWSLARPVGMTVVLCTVFSQVFSVNIFEYAPFLFASVALWQFLTESVMNGCRCFIAGSAYLRQQHVPVLIFPLRTVLGSAIHMGISLALAFFLGIMTNGMPSILGMLSLIPAMLLLLCLAVNFATIFGLMHTHFPDTAHLLEIVLQGLYFLTPVIYQPGTFDERSGMGHIVKFNPLTSVLELIRQPLLYGETPAQWHWQMATLFLVVTTIVAWWCMRKMERNLVFWV